jgi:hypothetical protein
MVSPGTWWKQLGGARHAFRFNIAGCNHLDRQIELEFRIPLTVISESCFTTVSESGVDLTRACAGTK